MPQAGIRAHSGTVQRLVGPVDLARFDSTVKLRRNAQVGRRGPQAAAFLCARYATVRACTPPEVLASGSAGRPVIIPGFASAVDSGRSAAA